MIFDFENKCIKLDEIEQVALLRLTRESEFSSASVLLRMMAVWNANFEQDAADALSDLEEDAENEKLA